MEPNSSSRRESPSGVASPAEVEEQEPADSETNAPDFSDLGVLDETRLPYSGRKRGRARIQGIRESEQVYVAKESGTRAPVRTKKLKTKAKAKSNHRVRYAPLCCYASRRDVLVAMQPLFAESFSTAIRLDCTSY